MPRTRRIIPFDAALHVMCRGNNKKDVFHNDNDRLRYYSLLLKFKEENKIRILHYCLMGNHIHVILCLDPASSLSKFMKQVNLTYVHYYKKCYGYSGHFWQDRFKSNIIQIESYLLQCGRYIELNPVQAGIVDHPADYAFSSYKFYAQGKADDLLTPSPVYLALSDSARLRQKQYVDFVVDGSIINSEVLRKKLYIGNQAFIDKLERHFKVKNRRKQSGRPPREGN